jgi:uncharacterized protein (TIGR03435 family)
MLLLKHLLLCLALQAPAFEVASVKPAAARSVRASMRGGPGTDDPGQISFANVTLIHVLLRAYDVKTYQVSGPDWLSSERYDIAAKIPPGTTKEQFNLMLQNLVAERFHLVLHHATKQFQGYELVAGKNGSKLKASESSGPDAPAPAAPPKTDSNGFPQLDGPGLVMMEGLKGRAVVSFLTARSQPISTLVDMLSREFRLPILDRTGLTGKFDFRLEFAPQAPGALVPATTGESGPNLLTAVREQLGLKLEPMKIPLEVLIIDHADKVPTEN